MSHPAEPRLFTMVRHRDETGVSGTGRVLDGVVFHNGMTVICWRSDVEGRTGTPSLCFYPSFEAFRAIHIDAHPGNITEVVWLAQGPPRTDPEPAE